MALVKIASLDELQPGQMKRVRIDEVDLAVYHVDGGYYVTSDVCTHAVASLTEGSLDGYVVTCPKHGGKFDVRTGAAVHLPAFTPLKTYQVYIQDGGVWIDAEEL
ncbi:MAG: non-heme iron oxygenase ferredoxin subunit [Alicyclobacillaceae bacterium]|nr:non-heme iron oxygenase ferredoxin subunit [Alicyclobacillaceae bacterium]